MSHLHNKQINQLDHYLLIFTDTEKVYETFRTISAAERFLNEHPLKDELKIITNPKYVTTKK